MQAGVQTTKSLHAFAIIAHLSLAFDFVTLGDLAHHEEPIFRFRDEVSWFHIATDSIEISLITE